MCINKALYSVDNLTISQNYLQGKECKVIYIELSLALCV